VASGATLTTLDLAGWRVRLECRPAELAASIAAQYASFVPADNTQPDLTAHVSLVGDGSVPALEEVRPTWNGKVWLLDAPGFSGTIDFIQAQAVLVLASTRPLIHLEYFLRVLYALLAHREGSLLVHAAGVLSPDENRVFLFIGGTGSGKSTVVRLLSRRAVALNDDLILVKPERDGWIAYGTPFWNTDVVERSGQTAHGPVGRVYSLVKDRRVYLELLSPALATAELAANCPVVNGDPCLLPALLSRCRAVASAVPIQRLHFRKDPGFWDLLLET
jgi:hypothetical protein